MMQAKTISAAATLILADAQKKIVDPQFRRKEKYLGLLPRNHDSPFGDFPPEFKPHRPPQDPSSHIQLCPTQNLTLEAPSPSKRYLKKGEGSGGIPTPRLLLPPPCAESSAEENSIEVEDTAGRGCQRGTCAHRHRSSSARLQSLARQRTVPASQAPPPPPTARAFSRKKIAPSEFRRFYDRGDLPISVSHGGTGNKISWKVDIEKLDYHHYLPIFFDGLREKEDPYRFLAVQGVYDALEHGRSKILPVIPQLIIPIKTALNTRDPEVLATVLKVLQALVVSGEMIGEALVPYYRQILPVCNLFKNWNLNTGDHIDYSQRKRQNLGDLIEETLEIFELHGGEDAFINIKYMIPTYESCVLS
eukprot:GHVQ01001977.1.p1 GENE.GHVQ01001977.1~~GHVQ01001977.1.p1  ORF type:complete len:361 (+),score=49.30 GHVQ01001977.1:757-1839(+)